MSFRGILFMSAAAGGGASLVDLWAAAVVANGGSVSADRVNLWKAFVAAEAASGAWDRTDDYFPFVAENTAQALTSLKQRRLGALIDAPSFTIDRGFALDGSNDGVNTGLIPSTHCVAATGSDIRSGVYERTNVAATTYALGSRVTASRNIRIIPRSAGDNINGGAQCSDTNFATSITDSRGLTVLSNGIVYEGYKNGVSTGTVSPGSESSTLSSVALYFGGANVSGVLTSPRASTIGFGFIGASLTAAQELAQYNAIQTFMTAVGANV